MMKSLLFEWDNAKADINSKKHGVTFEEAKSVFTDEHGKLISDPDHSDGEDRFVLLGVSAMLRTLVVVHCYRADDRVIRIISARKASKPEAKFYTQR
jgi:uncharacterized protein